MGIATMVLEGLGGRNRMFRVTAYRHNMLLSTGEPGGGVPTHKDDMSAVYIMLMYDRIGWYMPAGMF